jgi:hypothetical protein
MRTVTNSFKEIYGNNGPLGKKNMSPSNMLNTIVPEQDFTNNATSNFNKNMNKPVSEDIAPPFQMPYLLIVLVLVILGAGLLFYFNKDKIMQYVDEKMKEFQKPKEKEEPKKEEEKEEQKEEEPTIKEKEKEEKQKNEKIKKGGVNELNEKLNTNYTPNQMVKEDGFCYIGYENGQRECANVFDGDICMSGEIFPKLDICINPRLRP